MKKLITTSTTLRRMAERNKYSLLITVAIVFICSSSFANGDYKQCQTSLRNIVVYEGTLDTLIDCTIGPNGTAWSVRPTSVAALDYDIVNFDDTVARTYTGLYALNETGLIVRNATATNDTTGPISTAGIYQVSFNASNSNNRTAFKLVVIRSGPICSCNQTASGRDNISCTIIYGDSPNYQINPIISCTANDQFYNASTLMKDLVPSSPIQYVYSTTSSLIINNTGSAFYDCLVTFGAPVTGTTFLAKNAPDFSAARQVSCGPTTTALPTTTTQMPATTNSISETITVPQQTVPSQQVSSGKETLLSVEVLLSVVLGCIFLTAVVCCCWACRFFPGCCQRRFRRQPIYVAEANEIGIAEENGFWRRRHIPRYTGNTFQNEQLSYRNRYIL